VVVGVHVRIILQLSAILHLLKLTPSGLSHDALHAAGSAAGCSYWCTKLVSTARSGKVQDRPGNVQLCTAVLMVSAGFSTHVCKVCPIHNMCVIIHVGKVLYRTAIQATAASFQSDTQLNPCLGGGQLLLTVGSLNNTRYT
jgi:hypothetical protein